MKKAINKKALILPLFILGILAINLVAISAASAFEETAFFEFIGPYFIPSGMEGISGLIIGIVSLAILFVIFLDVFSLIPVFSRVTTKFIAIGLAIIMVVFKMNVYLAGWLFAAGSAIFGWAGTFAVVLIIILAIFVLIAMFFGGNWATRWLIKMRTTKETQEKVTKAQESGGDIRALKELAEQAKKS